MGVLQDRGQHVALVTDGRMSGASGKVPAAIHVSPEAVDGGMIAEVHTGDSMGMDSEHGILQLDVQNNARAGAKTMAETEYWLDLFSVARKNVGAGWAAAV